MMRYVYLLIFFAFISTSCGFLNEKITDLNQGDLPSVVETRTTFKGLSAGASVSSTGQARVIARLGGTFETRTASSALVAVKLNYNSRLK